MKPAGGAQDRPTADDAILARVRAIVTDIAGAGRVPADAGPDTPLGEEGFWLDSTEMLEVILACEREFGISFGADTSPGVEGVSTVRSLAEAIRIQVT